jgi:hypothetical protein
MVEFLALVTLVLSSADADLDLRPPRFDLASSSSQIQSRPSLVQPPQGRWPEHLDFLPLHRRQAVFALVCSGGDVIFPAGVAHGCLELEAWLVSEARCMCGDCGGWKGVK